MAVMRGGPPRISKEIHSVISELSTRRLSELMLSLIAIICTARWVEGGLESDKGENDDW
jgi:hypothetical protein